MPEISVIVPVYNVEKYIHRCVDSILAQTYTDFELILVDDGSTDDSGIICEDYKKNDDRIVIIHKENGGQSSARNMALDIAKGEYIAFIDSDDYVNEHYLETLYTNITEFHATISVCGCLEFTDNIPTEIPLDNYKDTFSGIEFIHNYLFSNDTMKAWVLWDKLWHKSCFDEFRLPVGRIHEDNASVYKLLYNAEVVVDCNRVLYYYQQNDTSTMHKKYSKKNLDWLLVPKEMISFFSMKKEPDILKKSVFMYIRSLYDAYHNVLKYLSDPTTAKEIKKELKNIVKKNKRKYSIRITEYPNIYESAFPFYAKCYWTYKGILSKFKKK